MKNFLSNIFNNKIIPDENFPGYSMYVCMYVCMCVRIVCMYVFMYVCMYVLCMYLYVCMYVGM